MKKVFSIFFIRALISGEFSHLIHVHALDRRDENNARVIYNLIYDQNFPGIIKFFIFLLNLLFSHPLILFCFGWTRWFNASARRKQTKAKSQVNPSIVDAVNTCMMNGVNKALYFKFFPIEQHFNVLQY